MNESSADEFGLRVVERCLYVLGDVDAAVVARFAAALDDRAVDVVNLRGVTFMDTDALHALLNVWTQRSTSTEPLAIREVSAAVRRLLELTGLLDTVLASPPPRDGGPAPDLAPPIDE